ncbi:MAG: hypothetical protein OdinLCB4_000145 [Candidatus Odinarchaeum yellowstonii]|uniref:Uncharacterized protein n=1 Tax=Odinarchaeota yellowstonii (strain LCB_4) TaxID=1841599 RepID=A0AAF0D2C8_ODILC|nr:MAG: hypothetical protein OdinLCB4_000145 [Candidatus Odinarchaeum yellowstonii]
MNQLILTADVKEKIMSIAYRTRELLIKQSQDETRRIYEELSNIWRYLNKLQSFEIKPITEIIINMSIALEAYLAGAITKEELIVNILKNKIVSELVNHIDNIN